jgi:hypothetical protein
MDAAQRNIQRRILFPANFCNLPAVLPDAFFFDTGKYAVRKALELSSPDTIIYIGGSTFVVSEALPLFE